MAGERLGREAFFAAMSTLDEAALRTVLWTLYYRGSAAHRERIEALITPGGAATQARPSTPAPPEAAAVLREVSEFAALARSGAYLAGNRRVPPKERTRWRMTFRRLAEQSVAALAGDDLTSAERAVATVVDLACETIHADLFRSQDPMEAARFIVSDAVGALWARVREVRGEAAFTASATAQLVRWEQEYGWTRYGYGWVAERETTLTTVLAGMLDSPPLWRQAARDYVSVLDRCGGAGSRRDRADTLCAWHVLLIEHLLGTEGDALLDRISAHPALSGPDLIYVKARLAFARGDLDAAHDLIRRAITSLPGNTAYRELADDIAAQRDP